MNSMSKDTNCVPRRVAFDRCNPGCVCFGSFPTMHQRNYLRNPFFSHVTSRNHFHFLVAYVSLNVRIYSKQIFSGLYAHILLSCTAQLPSLFTTKCHFHSFFSFRCPPLLGCLPLLYLARPQNA